MTTDKAKEQEQVYWCAWHPNRGFEACTLHKLTPMENPYGIESILLGDNYDNNKIIQDLRKDGLQIRKVKLVDADSVVVPRGLMEELKDGDGVYYIAQERAMAPGIAGDWPDIIPHPTNRNGRLLKRVLPRQEKEG